MLDRVPQFRLQYPIHIWQVCILLSFSTLFLLIYYTTITNTADSRGNWIGTAPFNYYLALYSLTLNGFSITSNSQYNSMMSSFQAALQNIGSEGNVNNLGFNIILWCSFISYYNIQSPGVYPFLVFMIVLFVCMYLYVCMCLCTVCMYVFMCLCMYVCM